ncbi:ABC-2 transporter permease [Streptomyces sp. YIM S03343]
MLKKMLVALGIVLVVQSLFALCLISALQLLAPRNMPFGVTGASPVVNAVTSKVSLQTFSYADESAVLDAIDQSKLYGAYLPGTAGDKLIVVPAKSFFGQVELEADFVEAAKKLGRPLSVQTVKPLPQSDRLGGVAGLLLLPVLIGGYLAAVLLQKMTRTAAAPWRVTTLVAYSAVGALVTDLIAGPGIGAFSNSHFWPLLPCLFFVTAAVALAAAALQRLIGGLGTLLVVVLFIIVGGASAGGSGLNMLPVYWQHIGVVLPPQNAVTLFRNVLYFGGNNITAPCVILAVYTLVGGLVINLLGWRSFRTKSSPGTHAASRTPQSDASGRSLLVRVLVALAIAGVMQCLFTANYTSSGHSPVATDLPVGVTGTSPVLTAAQKNISLKVHSYKDEAAAKNAIDEGKIYGALVPGSSSNTLIVVPTLSDVAPLDLAVSFEKAAKSVGQPLTVTQYAPHPLAKKDPFGLVVSLMMVPLFIGGYMSSTMLRTVTGTPTGPWRVATLAAYAVLAALVIDLIVCYWLQGIPAGKFWITWPILSLVMAGVAFVAAVLQKLIGAAGTLVTVIVVMLFGNPSSGGANGVPYLPGFWRDIGPFLPPRNAYILLRNTIYFDGHGTTQALTVLLVYLVIPAAVLSLLGWFRTPQLPITPQAEAEAAAVAVPVGALP